MRSSQRQIDAERSKPILLADSDSIFVFILTSIQKIFELAEVPSVRINMLNKVDYNKATAQ